MAKYLKQDCENGFIEDNAEIEYTRFNNLRHSVLGFMMGDFDKQGVYVISPEIRAELIKMPKYIVDSMDNIDICASVLKLDKQLTFMVSFEGERVTLSLMEKISYEANNKLNSGSYSNINEYVLDEVETSGVINKNLIYEMWNISEFSGAALDVFNMDQATIEAYYNITKRFKYLMVSNKILLQNERKLEEIEATYANRMLDILKAYPKLKAKVEKELKETLNEKKDFIRMDKPNFAKTLNEVIEKSIENNLDVLTEKEKENFKQDKHEAQMEANILRRDVVDIKVKTVEVDKVVRTENTEVLGPEAENTAKEVVEMETAGLEGFSIVDIAQDFVTAERQAEETVHDELKEDLLKGTDVGKGEKEQETSETTTLITTLETELNINLDDHVSPETKVEAIPKETEPEAKEEKPQTTKDLTQTPEERTPEKRTETPAAKNNRTPVAKEGRGNTSSNTQQRVETGQDRKQGEGERDSVREERRGTPASPTERYNDYDDGYGSSTDTTDKGAYDNTIEVNENYIDAITGEETDEAENAEDNTPGEEVEEEASGTTPQQPAERDDDTVVEQIFMDQVSSDSSLLNATMERKIEQIHKKDEQAVFNADQHGSTEVTPVAEPGLEQLP